MRFSSLRQHTEGDKFMKFITTFIRHAIRTGLRHQLALLLMAGAAIVSCYTSATAADLALIDAAALKGNPAKWVILDARPKIDWEAGHIPGSIHFSWENFT